MEISVDVPIFTQKNSKISLRQKYPSLQYGRQVLWKFFIFMGLKQFSYYFVIPKTPSLSNKKWKLAYRNQYSKRKNTKGSTGTGYSHSTTQDVFWNNFQIFITLLGFQVFLFCIFNLYLILLAISQ